MRILILTQWFQPEPFFTGMPLAKALQDRGHHVEVLTGFPNYPGGTLYPGYSVRPWQREMMDGVPVVRTALYPSHDRSGLRRAANYLSFGASAAALAPFLTGKPDVVYVYNLVTLGLAARMLRRLRGARVVLHVQDLWPESVATSGMLHTPLLLRALESWCRFEYRSPDRLVVQSPGFRRNLEGRGVPAEKIEVVPNWCDEASMVVSQPNEELARELGFVGRFNIVFAGTIGRMQGLESLLPAIRKLQEHASEVMFTFIGGGVEVESLASAAAGMPNVQILPPRHASEIGQVLALADALLVHLKEDPLFEITVPSKVQAYMFAGKPVLCGVKGDAASLVRTAGAGEIFAPEDADSFAKSVLKLAGLDPHELREMGERGRRFYQEHLSFAKGMGDLERIFAAVCAGQASPSAIVTDPVPPAFAQPDG